MYTTITLSSGRTVNIRPLSWDLFWELTRNRLVEAPTPLTAESVDDMRRHREASLAHCVQDFAELTELSVREVREMEMEINKLSEPEIAEGNS